MYIVTSYDPDSQFNWSALSRLQEVGIKVLTALADLMDQERTKKIRKCGCPFEVSPIVFMSGVESRINEDLPCWLSNKIVPGTWHSLYNVLGELDYGEELSRQIESYLTGEYISILTWYPI